MNKYWNIYISILGLFLIGCSPVLRALPQSDKELLLYVDEFEQLTGHEYNNPIYFVNFEKAGLCRKYSDGYKEILIDKFTWEHVTNNQKRQLVFHELGHCVLNLKHNDIILTDGCPQSIMFYRLISDNCLNMYWNDYERELL